MFWRNITPPSSWLKNKKSKKSIWIMYRGLLPAHFKLGSIFDIEDGGGMFLQNVDWLSMVYMVL
jgi:hypothetical protein